MLASYTDSGTEAEHNDFAEDEEPLPNVILSVER